MKWRRRIPSILLLGGTAAYAAALCAWSWYVLAPTVFRMALRNVIPNWGLLGAFGSWNDYNVIGAWEVGTGYYGKELDWRSSPVAGHFRLFRVVSIGYVALVWIVALGAAAVRIGSLRPIARPYLTAVGGVATGLASAGVIAMAADLFGDANLFYETGGRDYVPRIWPGLLVVGVCVALSCVWLFRRTSEPDGLIRILEWLAPTLLVLSLVLSVLFLSLLRTRYGYLDYYLRSGAYSGVILAVTGMFWLSAVWLATSVEDPPAFQTRRGFPVRTQAKTELHRGAGD